MKFFLRFGLWIFFHRKVFSDIVDEGDEIPEEEDDEYTCDSCEMEIGENGEPIIEDEYIFEDDELPPFELSENSEEWDQDEIPENLEYIIDEYTTADDGNSSIKDEL